MSHRGLDLSLYVVTDAALCGHRGVVSTARAAVHGGATAIQVREPHASARELCLLAEAVHQALIGTGVPLLVNDRLDVALAIGAEGVHLGQGDLSAAAARRVAGPHLLIGLSVSTVQEAEEADVMPAGAVDYLGVGPVFATQTKTDAAPQLGVLGTERVRAATRLPCVAIGGVNRTNAAQVRATGVDGIAVVSAVCAAAEPEAAARSLLTAESGLRRR